MENQNLFLAGALHTGQWNQASIIMGCVSFLIFSVALLKARKGKDLSTHNPLLAWLRAGSYFSAALVISSCLGVFQSLINTDWINAKNLANPFWLGLTAIWTLQVFVGYTLIWPKGTFTLNRKLYLIPITIFGLCWGVFHSQMFLSIWALIELLNLHIVLTGLIAYAVISTANLFWQLKYWDVYISPEHNMEEWNNKKVMFCHAPNMLLGIVHLALFGDLFVFVALQTYALVVSAINMHFPVWWDNSASPN